MPPSKFEDLLDEIGTGLSGDVYDDELETLLGGSESISKSAFISWYNAFVNREDEASDCDSEIAEEKSKAEHVFDSFDEEKKGFVPGDKFEALFEALGSTYDKADHGRFIPELVDDNNRIAKSKFVSWYLSWLFADDDSDIGEDDEEASEENENEGGKEKSVSSIVGSGWGDAFKSTGWKLSLIHI